MLLGRMTAEQKMAVFLLSVMRATAEGKAATGSARETAIELPLSRTEIADYLGLTIETVSRQIARLRERNVISAGNTRSVVVHRPDVLTAIVDSAQAASHASFARVDA
jgi:CRP/FNR family transcriptional regulator